MSSPAQVAANQANAQKSTGPRCPSASRFNALRHGIDAKSILIPGEDPEEYNELAESYHRQYSPDSPTEAFHVAAMLRADWQKRRLSRVEGDLTRILLDENPGKSLAAALLTESKTAKLLARTQRQIAGLERTWHRADTAFLRDRNRVQVAQSKAAEFHSMQELLAEPALAPPSQLASFLQNRRQAESIPAASPATPKCAKPWPPIDPKTGKPEFFVG